MKRTNLVLDEQLLEEATKESGLKTYSATVNKALEEFVRKRKIAKIPQFFGSGIWHGDLSEMRRDNPPRLPRRRKTSCDGSDTSIWVDLLRKGANRALYGSQDHQLI